MDEPFILRVSYKGRQWALPARLVIQGYMHRFYIMIEDEEYIFELDDNREYRVIRNAETNKKDIDGGLLQAIVNELLGLQS